MFVRRGPVLLGSICGFVWKLPQTQCASLRLLVFGISVGHLYPKRVSICGFVGNCIENTRSTQNKKVFFWRDNVPKTSKHMDDTL
jgi:hypothetical protein